MDKKPQGKCEVTKCNITIDYIESNPKIIALFKDNPPSYVIRDKKGNEFAVDEFQLKEYVPDGFYKVHSKLCLSGPLRTEEQAYGNGLFIAIMNKNLKLAIDICKNLTIFEQIELLLSNSFYAEQTTNNINGLTYKRSLNFEQYFSDSNANYFVKLEKNIVSEFISCLLERYRDPNTLKDEYTINGTEEKQ